MTTMRAILYARVSTHDKGQDPATQMRLLRAFVKSHKWKVAREWVDYASAKDERGRIGWRNIMQGLPRGGFDVVLVTKLDRAFRSLPQTYQDLEKLAAYEVGFIAITQPDINTTTSTGKLMLAIFAALAEFESGMVSERVKEGMERAKAQGVHVGRPPGAQDKRRRKKRGYYPLEPR